MIIKNKLSYKCIWHGFKMSFMMTNINPHNDFYVISNGFMKSEAM